MSAPDDRLSELARSLVEAGRSADHPTAEQRDRTRYRLMGLLGASSLAGTSATAKAAASAAGTASGPAATGGAAAAQGGGLFSGVLSGTKLLTVLAATGSGVGAAVMIFQATQSVAPAASDVDMGAPSAVVVEAAAPAVPATEPEAEAEAEALTLDVDEIVPVPRARLAKPARAAQRRSGPERRPTLQQELTLIGAAQVQLRNGDPAAALATLERHAKRYPRGALRQEGIAARAIALCEMGRVSEGKKLVRALRRDAPSSPLAPRVERACTGSTANDSP